MIWVKTVAIPASIPASSQWCGSGVAACSETVECMTDLVGPGTPGVAPRPRTTRDYVLDIVIPVHNEERDLPGSIRRLRDYLDSDVPYPARITVADNASSDGTLAVA